MSKSEKERVQAKNAAAAAAEAPKNGGGKIGFSEATAGMSLREKAGYIWEYYRLPIVAGVIVVILIVYFLNTLVFNPPKKTFMEVAVLDAMILDEDRARLAADLGELLIPADMRDRNEVLVDSFYAGSETDPQYNSVIMQKFTAMIVTREINLMIFGAASLRSWGDMGAYADLGAVFDAGTFDAHADRILRMSFADPNDASGGSAGPEYACAVKLDGNGFLSGYGIDTTGMYMAVAVGSEKNAAVRQALGVILGW
ncbi:MAG: hypothetical protein FWC55_09150 [Firmicutes bacterium]|nr:hypothetical protein [Bacillota bacterium]